MRSPLIPSFFLAALLIGFAASGAELVRLTPANYDEYAPQGKEVDAIYGDYVLRNEHTVAVIADAKPGRNANMMTRDVGGLLIDLTTRKHQSDQIQAYVVGDTPTDWEFVGTNVPISEDMTFSNQYDTVELRFQCRATMSRPEITLVYRLSDGDKALTIDTEYQNWSDAALDVRLVDFLRMDNSRDGLAVDKAPDGEGTLFWAYDPWFGQAYGVLAQGRAVSYGTRDGSRNPTRIEFHRDGSNTVSIQPGAATHLVRLVIPGRTLLDVHTAANTLSPVRQAETTVHVTDSAGLAVEGATVTIKSGDDVYGYGRTDSSGRINFVIPSGSYEAVIESMGSGSLVASLEGPLLEVTLPVAGFVEARITDEHGGPIPCKVQFLGKDGTPDPFFGPDSGARGVHNIRYSENGRFEQPLPQGAYDVIVSYGPEFDAIFTEIVIEQGKATPLTGQLVRSVQSPGWVSTEYHSHSTPSGDNASSQFGRVLNLLAEQIEFAPCTEHNRIDTYVPHLRRLGVEDLMATCSGMELTSSPGGLNHQNSFPLIRKPRTQDGGAPQTDRDPEVQIKRLAFWDGNSEKLVQQNHPDMPQMFFDRDLDGERDRGLEDMHPYMDVIEVHPPAAIFRAPIFGASDSDRQNRMATWLQLWNLGRGVPGVVNTDAHANYHGSGWLRNYVKSSTDDPARISTLEMVRASEKGHIIMTNGPYLEASVEAGGKSATAGETIETGGDSARLRVRVQCANWLDVDRVQIFVNGKPAPEMNYTRETHPDLFSDGVVKFDEQIALDLSGDAQIVVATIGQHMQLGPVMGPSRGRDQPVAVANPIFVDVDGNGFKPNGDTLGFSLIPQGSD